MNIVYFVYFHYFYMVVLYIYEERDKVFKNYLLGSFSTNEKNFMPFRPRTPVLSVPYLLIALGLHSCMCL